MSIIKCKFKFTELSDQNQLQTVDLVVPTDIKFYSFDSQFTILEKT